MFGSGIVSENVRIATITADFAIRLTRKVRGAEGRAGVVAETASVLVAERCKCGNGGPGVFLQASAGRGIVGFLNTQPHGVWLDCWFDRDWRSVEHPS